MGSKFVQTRITDVYATDFLRVNKGLYRHEDGEEVEREWVEHPGAVVIVPYDDEFIYLVSQPREAVGEAALLELPAGKLDVPGEKSIETAKRELAEEVGKGARSWQSRGWFYIPPGFTNERVELFLATGLFDRSLETDENERIEIIQHPRAEIESLLVRCHDAKTLIGLYALRYQIPN